MKKYEETFENCQLYFRAGFFTIAQDMQSEEQNALADKCLKLQSKVEPPHDMIFVPSMIYDPDNAGKPTYNQLVGINRFSQFLSRHFSRTSFVFNILPNVRLNWTSHPKKKYQQICRALEEFTEREKEIITRENLRTDEGCGHTGSEWDCYAQAFWEILKG